jgi:hypothetical protein
LADYLTALEDLKRAVALGEAARAALMESVIEL